MARTAPGDGGTTHAFQHQGLFTFARCGPFRCSNGASYQPLHPLVRCAIAAPEWTVSRNGEKALMLEGMRGPVTQSVHAAQQRDVA